MRLSTILILMCLFGAVIAPSANRYVKHRHALSWLRTNDGHVIHWKEGLIYDTPKSILVYGSIESLRPVQEFSELEFISVSSRQSITRPCAKITDLSPIKKLSKLRSIEISTTEKVELPEVVGMESLQSVAILSPHLVNLRPIAKYHGIVEINLFYLVEILEVEYIDGSRKHVKAKSPLPESQQRELEMLKQKFPNTEINYRSLQQIR